MDKNGIITSYEVRYSYDNLEPQTQQMNGAELVTELNNLAEAELYSIEARAYTSVGPGPYSDPIMRMTRESGM